MIAILDYGSGNLRSALRAFENTGVEVKVTNNSTVIKESAGLVIPGVGAFGACMEQLEAVGGGEIVRNFYQSGKAIFGICVGMQILFSESNEKGLYKGLGIFDSKIRKLRAPVLPQIGWNSVRPGIESKLFKGVEESSFYFVHSYAAHEGIPGSINTVTNYEENFLAAIEYENVSATQFHPEKSGSAGLRLIKNWVSRL